MKRWIWVFVSGFLVSGLRARAAKYGQRGFHNEAAGLRETAKVIEEEPVWLYRLKDLCG